MNKRGISTIVATVLIVLITVAAVTILWAAISPLIDKNLQSGTLCFDAQNSLSIDTNRAYTCFNSSATNDTISYRVERNSNQIGLEGASLIYSVDGNSNEIEISTPSRNGNMRNTTISTMNMIENTDVTLSVAPRILIDGEVIECAKSNPITISACN